MSGILISDHARFQMKERGVSEKLVLKTVEIPQVTFRQSDGRIRSIRKFTKNGKEYAIVVISEEGLKMPKKVITTFITSKVSKYFIKL
jgi:vacuolar-type H+-ATPase subunit F/Vma7